MKSFADWLREAGLERYASVFAENDIDLRNAHALSEADLKELGLTLGHRKDFLAAVTALEASTQSRPADLVAAATGEAGERRQLTVMFCDLVGSTALSEKLDPEELRSLLHDYRTRCGEVIARYEGYVARLGFVLGEVVPEAASLGVLGANAATKSSGRHSSSTVPTNVLLMRLPGLAPSATRVAKFSQQRIAAFNRLASSLVVWS